MAAWERSYRSRFTQGFTLRALRLRESRAEVCPRPRSAPEEPGVAQQKRRAARDPAGLP